jgi:hypothetical protein
MNFEGAAMGKPQFKQRDVERAIRAARHAGGARVEIKPADGVITIIMANANPAAPANVNPFDAEAKSDSDDRPNTFDQVLGQ